MGKERLVVIGGDAAGMSAASNARRRRNDLEIIALERGAHVSYAACGIPYYVGKLLEDAENLVRRSPETFREKMNIDVRTKQEVIQIDLSPRRVFVRDVETHRQYPEPFDHLVIATGAVPIRPPVEGVDSRGIYSVKYIEDGVAIRRAIEEERPQTAVIVGGGYIGIEMAEALLMRGLQVSMIDMLPEVMGTLDIDMGALVSGAVRDAGVTLHLEEKLEAFVEDGGRLKAVVTDKRELPCDIAILGIGVRPNSRLAGDAGIALGEKGAIKVNEWLETQTECVWAAGDCVESFNLVSEKPAYVALGTVANKQGRIVGINIGGGRARFPGVLGSAITKFMDTEVARTGLQERELKALGLEYASARIEARVKSGYYPKSGKMTVKLFGEKGTGRILGGQIVGTEGAGSRIQVVATALQAGMTAEDITHLDLAYAPPFSAPWDPVHIAARQLIKEV
jgi:NADPH-dependent 2,4-dienoyl-CoA reductase/sulfur reductase-like enzyme